MPFADLYIEKNRSNVFVEDLSNDKFEMIVVIPCYDEPEISATINSLCSCSDPGISVGVVVVVNSAENSPEEVKLQNRTTIIEIHSMLGEMPAWLHLSWIESANLPSKHAGVGWARKIGMDWAVTHFNRNDNDRGIIISLDADTIVDPNYFAAIYSFFTKETKRVGATIYFEHPISDDITGEAIVFYELYMRYYKQALAFTGFPNSFYTVGSCFAVLASAYVAQGGMNRKKAGEDFYFLHKLSLLGELGVIKSTTVSPSSRFSNRVPFGTGKVLQQYSNGDRDIEMTYSIESFLVLKDFFASVEYYYLNSSSLKNSDFSKDAVFQQFCVEINFLPDLLQLISNCSSLHIFRKRFFHLFNAFIVLKWLNFALQNGFAKGNIILECSKLLHLLSVDNSKIPDSPKLMLSFFRKMDNESDNQ